MSGSGFEYRQHHHMNAGAHRRPPPQIGAPALTWQRAYWLPKGEHVWLSDDRAHESAWRRCIDNTLAHLLRSIQSSDDPPFISPNYNPDFDTLYLFDHKITGFLNKGAELTPLAKDERSVRHDVFVAKVQEEGVWLTITARRHHEYFTILFSLDFSDSLDEGPSGDINLCKICNSFLDLHELIKNRHQKHRAEVSEANPLGSPFDQDLERDTKDAETLAKNLVDTFKIWINDKTNKAFSKSFNKVPGGLSLCGDQFSDFIGIVYNLSLLGNGELGYPNHPKDRGELKRSFQVFGSNFRGRAGLDVLNAAWPAVVASDRNQKQDRMYGEPERVVAAFNSGQSLYASSLGRRMPDAERPDLEPLIFTLIVSYLSPWRLGRLIDKINTLGILRLAALRDLREINEVSNSMNEILSNLGAYDQGRQGFSNMMDIEERFRIIDKDLEVGIKYRVERSRYYFKSYETTLASLRPERVVGFQFYKDFVISRVYDAFDYIDRVGKRYDNLRQEIKLRISSHELRETRNLQKSIEIQTKSATSLLSAAEILSIAPLTYYGGHILFEWMNTSAYRILHITLNYCFAMSFCASCLLSLTLHHVRKAQSLSVNGGVRHLDPPAR